MAVGLPFSTCTLLIHWSDGYIWPVTPATQTGPEAVLKLPADKVESDWVYTGIQRGHVDPNVVHD